MKPASLILASCLTFAGCSTMTVEDCRSTNWYQLGWRDGSASGISAIDQYTAQCAASGSQPDAARYAKGWEAGRWEKDHRHF